jgi:O-acetylserine/cysteine efflux transporter
VLAGLSWGAGNVVSRASRAPGGLALTVWSATVVPVPLLGLSLLVDGPSAVGHGLEHLGTHGILSTVYTAGLCSLVGYAVFNRLLSRYPSGQVVPWVLLAPVVAMACSWPLLGEVPGTAELAGAVLLVIGVLVTQGTIRLPGSRRESPAAVPDERPDRRAGGRLPDQGEQGGYADVAEGNGPQPAGVGAGHRLGQDGDAEAAGR